MAEPEKVNTPLLDNILGQPSAIRSVADHHLGEGRRNLLHVAQLLRGATQIVLTGMGASLFACMPLQHWLAVRGLNAVVVEASELLYFLESQMTAGTVVLLVSRSGESVELVKLLDVLDRRGCKSVGVTNLEGSALDARTTAQLVLHSPADQMVAIQSYQATLLTLALLGAACTGELDVATAEFQSIEHAFSEWVKASISASETWREFAALSFPLYVLGRGSSMASVAEGVLLMHEAGKTPAVGMSCAQFRHGPVEVTGKAFRAVVLATQPLTREIDFALATDLQAMGGQIRWIGPQRGESALLAGWPERIPDRFLPLFEVVPFQLLAYRTAEARGLVPGEFRWAPLVTSSETGFPGISGS